MIKNLKLKIAVSLGLHEKPVSRFVKKLKGKIFVDVGANYGYYCMLLHKNFQKIYAFEPMPKFFNLLKSNIMKLPNVQCYRKAISNVNGTIQISYNGATTVETATLAALFPNTQIDLIKVDVEGMEWQVLEGAEPILNNIKAWIIELHEVDKAKELERWFQNRGYSFKWLDFRYRGSLTANHIYAFRRSKKTAVVDMDDTLAIPRKMTYYLWTLSRWIFNLGVRLQKPNGELLQKLKDYDNIIILTARTKKHQKVTEYQLWKFGIKPSKVIYCPLDEIIYHWKKRIVKDLGEVDWYDNLTYTYGRNNK
ncbi:MAG: FkbM family methyltransferase [Nitrososphaeria archaeon]